MITFWIIINKIIGEKIFFIKPGHLDVNKTKQTLRPARQILFKSNAGKFAQNKARAP